MVKAATSLYDGAKKRFRIWTELSEELYVEVGVHQGLVLSPLLFVIVVDEITANDREGLLMEILYADDLVLISETLVELKEEIYKWKDTFERKGWRVAQGRRKWWLADQKDRWQRIR